MSELEKIESNEIMELVEKARKAHETMVFETRNEDEDRIREAEERNLVSVLELFGVAKIHIKKLKYLINTKSVGDVKKWMESDKEIKPLLILEGPPGIGKSVASAWWLKTIAEGMTPSANISRRWYTACDLQRIGNYSQDLDFILNASSLVIDDLGIEFLDEKGNFQSILEAIIDKRTGNFLRTIITTNLSILDLRKRYGVRICDRISFFGQIESAVGPSMRKP